LEANASIGRRFVFNSCNPGISGERLFFNCCLLNQSNSIGYAEVIAQSKAIYKRYILPMHKIAYPSTAPEDGKANGSILLVTGLSAGNFSLHFELFQH